MQGDAVSLDFDSIHVDGTKVTYNEQVVISHDPRFHVPENYFKDDMTLLANCDEKLGATVSFSIYHKAGRVIGHGQTPEANLQYSRYGDSMDQLLLGIACSRVNGKMTAAPGRNAGSGPSNAPSESVQESANMATGGGVTFHEFPDGSEVSDDRSGKGAVMCMWGLDVSLLAIGTKCTFEEDGAFNDELRTSIKSINRFIVQNRHRQPITSEKIGSDTEAELARYEQTPGLCSSDFVKMYGYLRSQGPAALRASTKELLSVPREPVVNPCF